MVVRALIALARFWLFCATCGVAPQAPPPDWEYFESCVYMTVVAGAVGMGKSSAFGWISKHGGKRGQLAF
jgi:hypothetical protein